MIIFFCFIAHIWKKQRKQVLSTFNSQNCWSFLPVFNQKSNEFIQNIDQHVGKDQFDILKYSAAAALDIVCGEDFTTIFFLVIPFFTSFFLFN